MPQSPLESLRERIHGLEETQRRFSRTIPVADQVDRWLPHGGLSAGCIHEIKGTSLANAIAFSTILSSRLAGEHGNIIYLAPDRSLHPLGLLPYRRGLDRILYVSAKRPQDLAWAAMESLRCSQTGALIALLGGLDLAECRRLQLAAEASGATGFFLGSVASTPMASPITRWKVSSEISKPGQRFDAPIWTIELLYCRGGRPGNWTLEWRNQKLNAIQTPPAQADVREELAG